VIHYTEDIATRAFQNWYCKSINTTSATREIKAFADEEKVQTIYNSMVEIGHQAQTVQQKGEAAVIA
jgi:hypothetical protein